MRVTQGKHQEEKSKENDGRTVIECRKEMQTTDKTNIKLNTQIYVGELHTRQKKMKCRATKDNGYEEGRTRITEREKEKVDQQRDA